MIKKLLTIALCVVMLVSMAPTGNLVSAEVATITGIRWFPCPENRQNDDAWEVECVADGCLCQRFTETAEDTGHSNYLATEYTENGGLKLSRSNATVTLGGVDHTEYYWPRIRTLTLETSPAFDIKTGDTLYFNVDVASGSQWNLSLAFNGLNISLGKYIAQACGVDLDATAVDAPAGTYTGSLNLNNTLNTIASDPANSECVNAQVLLRIKKLFTPQLQIYCIGGLDANLTIHELYISTAEDTAGDKCPFFDMGLLTGLGDAFYGTDTDTVRLGDVNLDGIIDLDDATRLFYHVNELLTLTGKALLAADFNESGAVDLDDAVRLFYHVNRLIG